MMFTTNKKSETQHERRQAAFTLVELLVVMGIVGLITAVTIFKYRKNDYQATLIGIAHSIDVTLHEAQTYGTAVRQFTKAGGTQTYSVAYGLSLSWVTSPVENNAFILYGNPLTADSNDTMIKDVSGNPSYISGSPAYSPSDYTKCLSTEGCVERQTLKPGYYISSIVSIDSIASPSNFYCNNQLVIPRRYFVIYDVRSLVPQVFDNQGCTYTGGYLSVTIRAPDGSSKELVVDSSGSTHIN
jgi:prepilin-type N-terminal cleavage/methylation domain-containing protein